MSKKMKFETKNIIAENIAKLAELFPEAVAEGKVNIDLLRLKLGDEAYEFTWVGKREAIAEIGRPTRKTLRPFPEESREIASQKLLRAVFCDSSFTNSPKKINALEIFKQLAPNTNVRVI